MIEQLSGVYALFGCKESSSIVNESEREGESPFS